MHPEPDELHDRTLGIMADLAEAVLPRDGERFGHLTRDEARRLVRDLVWLAAYLVRTRAR